MKILAGIVAMICLVLIIATWGSPLAVAWTVAFCGWLPQAFESSKSSKERDHGHQA